MKHLEPELIEEAASQAPSGEIASHLASCADCRGHVRRAQGRQRLLSGMRLYTLSDLAFRRVEARLDEAVAAGDVSPSAWRWSWWAGGTLAAAVMAVLVVLAIEPRSRGVVSLPLPQVAVVRAPFHPLTVLRAAPGAQVRRGEAQWHALSPGDEVVSGDALSAEALKLAPSTEVSWAIDAQGSLALGGAASLTLGAGEVVAQVGSPIEVLVASRRMVASSALFSVSRAGAEVVLVVSDGEVEVIDAVSGERRKIKAPQAVRWSDGSSLADGRAEPMRSVRRPVIPSRPWARFDASGLLDGTMVSLDGVQLGAAPFIELVTAGRRRLSLALPNGALLESWAELIGGQPFTVRPEIPLVENDAPEPDAEALARVLAAIKAQRPKLAACYEKWLKANASAQGEVVLELMVNAKGRVKKARVESGTMSAASSECLVTTAKSLVLPPLGTEATLQVPLLLRQPGR